MRDAHSQEVAPMEALNSAITAMMHFVSRPGPARKRAILANDGGEPFGPVSNFCPSDDIDERGMGRIRFIVAMQFRVKMDGRYDLQRGNVYGTFDRPCSDRTVGGCHMGGGRARSTRSVATTRQPGIYRSRQFGKNRLRRAG